MMWMQKFPKMNAKLTMALLIRQEQRVKQFKRSKYNILKKGGQNKEE